MTNGHSVHKTVQFDAEFMSMMQYMSMMFDVEYMSMMFDAVREHDV